MNGNGTTTIIKPPAPSAPVLDANQKACVEVLTDALEEAMKGKITTLALVVCMDDGIAPIMVGSNAGGLMLGLEQLKHNIRCEIFEDGNMARKGKIVRAR